MSNGRFAHTYDDFVVPEGGWTVAGVFAHTSMAAGSVVSQAYWEIRSEVSAGSGGQVVASGLNSATMTRTATVGGGQDVFLLHVGGLWTPLPPGRYWLTVAPVTEDTQSYLCATLGANAMGEPKGMNANSFWTRPPDTQFAPVVPGAGAGGTSGDYSLGVLISGAPATRETAWRSNLLTLKEQMFSLHSLPFPGVTAEEFSRKATELSARVDSLSDAEIRTGVQELVASIGDPHTDVIWPNPRPYKVLPISLYWFDEGVYVTSAPEQYRGLLGGKVVAIGNSSIDEAIAKLTPLTPHDNQSWLKHVMAANKLTNADFLYGTGIAPSTDGAAVVVETGFGEARTAIQVDAVDAAAAPSTTTFGPCVAPICRRNPNRRYWATAIEDGEGVSVYFQYNSCTEDPAQPSVAFFAQLDQALAQPEVKRLIVDLRYNSGGLVGILNPWFERLKTSRFNQYGRLYVIVGRATYSAAMEHSNRFREETSAIFVGEPTGAKPRFLLRRGDFGLPYFGIRVSYSNGVERANDPGPTLMPDIRVPVTFEDYRKGVDPAMDAILRPWRRRAGSR